MHKLTVYIITFITLSFAYLTAHSAEVSYVILYQVDNTKVFLTNQSISRYDKKCLTAKTIQIMKQIKNDDYTTTQGENYLIEQTLNSHHIKLSLNNNIYFINISNSKLVLVSRYKYIVGDLKEKIYYNSCILPIKENIK